MAASIHLFEYNYIFFLTTMTHCPWFCCDYQHAILCVCVCECVCV